MYGIVLIEIMPRLVVESDHEATGIIAEYDRAVGIGRRSDKPVADRFDVEQGMPPVTAATSAVRYRPGGRFRGVAE